MTQRLNWISPTALASKSASFTPEKRLLLFPTGKLQMGSPHLSVEEKSLLMSSLKLRHLQALPMELQVEGFSSSASVVTYMEENQIPQRKRRWVNPHFPSCVVLWNHQINILQFGQTIPAFCSSKYSKHLSVYNIWDVLRMSNESERKSLLLKSYSITMIFPS